MDLDDINRELRSYMDLRNNTPQPDFEGRTPKEMFYMLNKPFDKDCPMQFTKKVDLTVLKQVPFLMLAKHFFEYLQKSGPVKLTAKGNLPLKTVKFLYDLGYFPSKYVDSNRTSIRSESNFMDAHIMRINCEIIGLVKKTGNSMALTKKGESMIKDSELFPLFKHLFINYTTKFNWAYADHFGDHAAGQFGFAFSMELLSVYGKKEREEEFYAQKFIRAFPAMLDDFVSVSPYFTAKDEAKFCYSLRTFHNFMRHFGLAELNEKGADIMTRKYFVKKTPVLDHLFVFEI